MPRCLARAIGLVTFLSAALLAGAQPVSAQDPPVTLIKVDQVRDLLKRGHPVLLVDVRSRQEYDARHIRGAASVPLDRVEARAAEIPRQGLVVLY
jgi:3-mercaptopyruvate sulfurtransferase SseA